MYNDFIPEAVYSQVVAQSNCTSATDSFACLVAVPVETISDINVAINSAAFFGVFTVVPVIDGTFIVRRPSESIALGLVNGQAYLGVTNTNEGVVFVSSETVASTNIMQYVQELFPTMPDDAVVEASLAYYNTESTLLAESDGIMGESIFICPTYYLLKAFEGRSYKGEFAIPPANHGNDIPWYFTSYDSAALNTPFQKAFSQGFLAFAMSLDPNDKFDSTNITPTWPMWSSGIGTGSEMLFNMTSSGDANVTGITTDLALEARCSYWLSAGQYTYQ